MITVGADDRKGVVFAPYCSGCGCEVIIAEHGDRRCYICREPVVEVKPVNGRWPNFITTLNTLGPALFSGDIEGPYFEIVGEGD